LFVEFVIFFFFSFLFFFFFGGGGGVQHEGIYTFPMRHR